jgi:hypothetical protein
MKKTYLFLLFICLTITAKSQRIFASASHGFRLETPIGFTETPDPNFAYKAVNSDGCSIQVASKILSGYVDLQMIDELPDNTFKSMVPFNNVIIQDRGIAKVNGRDCFIIHFNGYIQNEQLRMSMYMFLVGTHQYILTFGGGTNYYNNTGDAFIRVLNSFAIY